MINNICRFTPAAPHAHLKSGENASAKPVNFQESLQNACAVRDRSGVRQAAGKLSAEELSDLSKKYSPDHMTQEQFDAFLDELEEKGVLSKDDKMLVKNPNMRFGDVLEPHGISPGGAYVEAAPLSQPNSLLDYDSSAALYVKAMLEYELALAEKGFPREEDRQRIDALRKVSDILSGMQ